MSAKKSLSPAEHVELLASRGLAIQDPADCESFLRAHNYYRFSGYARYFQRAPHYGDNQFKQGTSFDAIRNVYTGDAELRTVLAGALADAELVLRTHFTRVIADSYSPYGRYLQDDFYTEVGQGERTIDACMRDIERSKDRHIRRFLDNGDPLPVWSAVEAWSFGTLSKAIERADGGAVADAVASSMGVAKAGFAYRVRALVYLRNRCAHHSRLWNHSVLDAGPTPNNVRVKAKRVAGQFEPRSVLDVVASLDDIVTRAYGAVAAPAVLPMLVAQHGAGSLVMKGLAAPISPRDSNNHS
ncbi:Abi family protein [Microbacterium oryzae]|uniref:Abi family protein n=1 Tax=Microbacterium oryzae TaxID=743009 RepID=UPI0025B05AC7|nr:Abi family protein [Microbacterium oryzae]MDN3311764.1 Abi family protein [Microbacterium oryzae]